MSEAQPDFLDPFDTCDWLPARELFRRLGFEPVPPEDVDDFQLRGRLWEFIYALAGRRFYLCHSDHLSDRELYTWLCDEWLEEEVADIPLEAEQNCHLDMTDFNNGTDPIIWLKYFATEKQRREFAAEHSLDLDALPAHVDPPSDRDRWLPEPPGTPPETGDEDLGFEDEDEETPEEEYNESDPLGLANVDAQIEAERRRQDMTAVAGAGPSEDAQGPVDELPRAGASILPPAELTEETLTASLWELLHHLASRGFYVLHTDHLSDRELYTELWTRGLRDRALLPGRSRTSAWFHDFVGSGSEADNQLSLRYYDTEAERAEHARQWPEDPMPPKEKPPFNRDWRAPRGPF